MRHLRSITTPSRSTRDATLFKAQLHPSSGITFKDATALVTSLLLRYYPSAQKAKPNKNCENIPGSCWVTGVWISWLINRAVGWVELSLLLRYYPSAQKVSNPSKSLASIERTINISQSGICNTQNNIFNLWKVSLVNVIIENIYYQIQEVIYVRIASRSVKTPMSVSVSALTKFNERSQPCCQALIGE